jgi:hypothetical protein
LYRLFVCLKNNILGNIGLIHTWSLLKSINIDFLQVVASLLTNKTRWNFKTLNHFKQLF